MVHCDLDVHVRCDLGVYVHCDRGVYVRWGVRRYLGVCVCARASHPHPPRTCGDTTEPPRRRPVRSRRDLHTEKSNILSDTHVRPAPTTQTATNTFSICPSTSPTSSAINENTGGASESDPNKQGLMHHRIVCSRLSAAFKASQ